MKKHEASKPAVGFAKPEDGQDGVGSIDEEEGSGEEEEVEEEERDERQSRGVIKLRPARNRGRLLSRSRSRRDLTDAGSPDANDRESVANVRFSAHLIAKTDLTALLPFALIAPGDVGKLRKRPESMVSTPPVAAEMSEDGHLPSELPYHPPAQSPHPQSVRNLPYLHGPPDDLKGVFTRKFRWGTVDVLDPNHCDFAALRTVVLSTHLKVRDPATFSGGLRLTD
jgi:hypothetical protein